MIINGIEYELIPQQTVGNPRKRSALLGAMLATAMMFEYTNPYAPRPSKPKPLPVGDVVAEFELIQLKQSKLSKKERDRVVAAFNRCYKIKNK